jgi:hypothetical protein
MNADTGISLITVSPCSKHRDDTHGITSASFCFANTQLKVVIDLVNPLRPKLSFTLAGGHGHVNSPAILVNTSTNVPLPITAAAASHRALSISLQLAIQQSNEHKRHCVDSDCGSASHFGAGSSCIDEASLAALSSCNSG